MIGLLPIIHVLCWVAILYAFLAALLYGIFVTISGGVTSGWAAATFALSGSSLLQLLLMFWFYCAWQKFWAWFPVLNTWLYPDVRGTWDMEITLGGSNQSGKIIEATAIVRQDFLRVSMDVVAPASTSVTLAAVPRRHSESGLPQLYYVFLITTRPEPGTPSKVYKGAAILDLDHLGDGELRGNYWTDAERSGHYRLYNRRPAVSAGIKPRMKRR